MSAWTQDWLSGRAALVVGEGGAVEAVTMAIAAHGGTVKRASQALNDAPEIAAAFDAAGDPCLDILVHAGTAMQAGAAETVGLDGWRASHSTDIDSRFLYAAEFARRRLTAGGSGAILLLMPPPRLGAGRVAALTAHGALDNLVKSLAVEWARDGVRVNAIASRVVEASHDATSGQLASLGELAAYLLSDYAAYVTGTVMGVREVQAPPPFLANEVELG